MLCAPTSNLCTAFPPPPLTHVRGQIAPICVQKLWAADGPSICTDGPGWPSLKQWKKRPSGNHAWWIRVVITSHAGKKPRTVTTWAIDFRFSNGFDPKSNTAPLMHSWRDPGRDAQLLTLDSAGNKPANTGGTFQKMGNPTLPHDDIDERFYQLRL